MTRTVVIAGRLVIAALSLVALLFQLSITVTRGLGVVNFFSYFTILSNLGGILVFVISAVRLARGIDADATDVALRGASVVYLAFVGVVFNTLLTGADTLGVVPGWVSAVHHVVMPIAVLVDWVVWPPRHRISRPTTMLYLTVPAAYTAYSLVRGAITGFYPYPFFDPSRVGGYGGVALYCLALLAAFLVIAVLVSLIGNRLGRSRRDRVSS